MTGPAAARPGRGPRRAVVAGLAGVALLLVAARGLRSRFVVVDVHGPSMAPTLAPGDRLLVRTVRPELIRTGDIVVLERATPGARWEQPPASGNWAQRRWLVKRVAATAGDPVPPTVPADALPAAVDAVVPPGQLVVLGDNPARSVDSRHFGWLPADRVLGVLHRRLPRPRAPGPGAGADGRPPAP